MPNAFALLGLPRVAALDSDALQKAWLEASRAAHPDQPGGDAARAAEVNAAYETLQTPEKRLKHLLDLHQVPWRAVPIDNTMMALFSQLGTALQNTTVFLKRRQSASSALAKALLFPEEMRLREQLEEIAATLEEKREGLLASLPALDTRLVSGDTTSLHELQTLQARLAYLGKWQTQVWEALLSLI
jgi:curved DNA-binding protein CbpA